MPVERESMDRLEELRRYTSKSATGLEIAAYFNPIVPKAQGYQALILDVFDTETLHANARSDPNIPPDRIAEIEAVDIVADASGLGAAVEALGLAGQFSYIVSSHNFEHLPDPIGFLRGCLVALRPGGTLTMAIPDLRACFDHFRMPSRLVDWLSAYHEGRNQPSAETQFDLAANRSTYVGSVGERGSCSINRDDPANFRLQGNMRDAYASYLATRTDAGPYRDAHCSTMFPETFALMVHDLVYLGLIDFELTDVTETRGHEFFVHLRKPVSPASAPLSDDAYYARREALLKAIDLNLGVNGFHANSVLSHRMGRKLKEFLHRRVGAGTMRRLSAMNRSLRGRA